jgi:lipopolysaccharide cholinephosphotransferase
MTQKYQISETELKQLQKIELEMLVELDRICRKYQIEYSLDGGTLLGAVRHKGFIPWDNDADVIMLRREYMKFRKACNKELDRTRFFLQDYQSDPEYRWGYAKLRRNNTKFVRQGQEGLKHQSVFMDILVADNVPDGYAARRLHHFLCFLIRKALYSEVGKHLEKNIFLKYIYRILSRIPRNWIFRVRNRLAARTNRRRTELISHYTLEYPKHCRYGLPRECFDEMIEMEFEGKIFYGFRNYHRYLSMYYGDYMTLPPKEKQIPKLAITELKLTEPE